MHLHDDALALLALGEEPTAEEAAHLEACDRCRAEVTSYGRVVRAARSTGTIDASVPPPQVWENIHSSLGLGPDVRRNPLEETPSAADPTSPAAPSSTRAVRNTAGKHPETPAGPPVEAPVSLDGKRRRRSTGWLAAAAVAALIAGAATWGVVRSLPPQPEVLASTALQPLPSYSDEGTATVDQLPDGERELVVTASSSQAEGYREVWLISPDITSMVSLGTMDGREARFRIPAGLDLSAYPIVDISDEPLDGNPEHSGNSILRGQLQL
ncbi:anti-sigma factor [Arthrobacter sp. Sa2CUA1]|uniref:Anti-sigma factor n=1 Tax=Arthrobacter gallicola TaxID=2762225 RepID=A0ABR8UPV1_9MICC|nr:anti-sigma factor [Arthrobacter gallicola]MBD7994397.1 anti-sigma factor [Arthrobacter gallicola]